MLNISDSTSKASNHFKQFKYRTQHNRAPKRHQTSSQIQLKSILFPLPLSPQSQIVFTTFQRTKTHHQPCPAPRPHFSLLVVHSNRNSHSSRPHILPDNYTARISTANSAYHIPQEGSKCDQTVRPSQYDQ